MKINKGAGLGALGGRVCLDPLCDVLLLQLTSCQEVAGVTRGRSSQVQVVCPIMYHHGNQRGGEGFQDSSPRPGIKVTIAEEEGNDSHGISNYCT